MTSTPSKGVVEHRATVAMQVRALRDGPGLPFGLIARQLKLSHAANAQRFYRNSVIEDVRHFWFKLPAPLKRRWWDETSYGTKRPPMALVHALAAALKGIKQCTS